jgi:hypothetical protein
MVGFLGFRKNETIPACLGMIIAGVIFYAFIAWSNPAPVEYINRKTNADIVQAGQVVTVYWKEMRRDQCSSITHRRLIAADGTITEFEPTKKPERPAGVELAGNFSFKIPPGLRSGPLTYRVRVEFKCNWMQRTFGGHEFVLPDFVFTYVN